jgi:hypothetical protein
LFHPERKNPHFKSSFILFFPLVVAVRIGAMNKTTQITSEVVRTTVMPLRLKTLSLGVLTAAHPRNAEDPTSMVLPGESHKRTEKLLTPDEVAILMDVKMSWLMDHVTRIEPIIPHIRIGKMVRFKWSAVAEWIDSLISTKPTWE